VRASTLGTGRTHQPASAVEQDAASLPYPAIPFFLQIAALKVMPEPRGCDDVTDTRPKRRYLFCVAEGKSATRKLYRLPGNPGPQKQRSQLTAHVDNGFRALLGGGSAFPAVLRLAGKSQYLQMLRKGLQVEVGFGARAADALAAA